MPYRYFNTNRTGKYSHINAYYVTHRESLEPINAQKYVLITMIYVFVIALKSYFGHTTVSIRRQIHRDKCKVWSVL